MRRLTRVKPQSRTRAREIPVSDTASWKYEGSYDQCDVDAFMANPEIQTTIAQNPDWEPHFRAEAVKHARMLANQRRAEAGIRQQARLAKVARVRPPEAIQISLVTSTRGCGARAPRVATNARTRGSRRGTSSSSRAGPDDGPSSEGDGEPPARPLLLLVHPKYGRVNAALAAFLRGFER
jgi:hypothetical protein